MTNRELMQQAIEAMEYADACLKKQLTTKTKHEYAQDLLFEAGTALRERLAQPEREPVVLETIYDTIICWDETDGKRSRRELARRIFALYTTPPRREWAGLTRDEVLDIEETAKHPLDFARSIEAKLKEKNNG